MHCSLRIHTQVFHDIERNAHLLISLSENRVGKFALLRVLRCLVEAIEVELSHEGSKVAVLEVPV